MTTMDKEEIISLTTQFFRETKGGSRPDDLTPETYSLIYKKSLHLHIKYRQVLL